MSAQVLSWSVLVAQLLLTGAMACASYRILAGPRAQDRVLGFDRRFFLLVAGRSAVAQPPDESAEGERAPRLERARGVEYLEEVRDARLALRLERVGGQDLGSRQEPLHDRGRRQRVPLPMERAEKGPGAGERRVGGSRRDVPRDGHARVDRLRRPRRQAWLRSRARTGTGGKGEDQ